MKNENLKLTDKEQGIMAQYAAIRKLGVVTKFDLTFLKESLKFHELKLEEVLKKYNQIQNQICGTP